GEKLEHFFKKIRKLFPKQIFMADCSTYEEAIKAESLGFDCVSTTLSGYTDYTSNVELPNFSMMEELVRDCQLPVIAEGGIWTPSQLRKSFDIGVHSAVIGTAITRPMEITRRFNEVVE